MDGVDNIALYTDIYDIHFHLQNFLRASNIWVTGRNLGTFGPVAQWQQISRGAGNPEFPTKPALLAVAVWWNKMCQGTT